MYQFLRDNVRSEGLIPAAVHDQSVHVAAITIHCIVLLLHSYLAKNLYLTLLIYQYTASYFDCPFQ